MSETLSCKAVAGHLRRMLPERFPGVAFAVTCELQQYLEAGTGSIRVDWVDGPRDSDVYALVNPFRSDAGGEVAITTRSGKTRVGRPLVTSIGAARDYSREVRDRAAELWSEQTGGDPARVGSDPWGEWGRLYVNGHVIGRGRAGWQIHRICPLVVDAQTRPDTL